MDLKAKQTFETMLRNGDYDKAETQLKKLMADDPGDTDAKLLYGACRLLRGDTRTARHIHDELAPRFADDSSTPLPERTFWQKYHNWIIYGTAAAALVVGGGIAVIGRIIGPSIIAQYDVTAKGVYAGPRHEPLEHADQSQFHDGMHK